CLAMARAEAYYESLGRTWERAAFIKARVCAGDHTAGARFLETLRPFIWRKYLDFAAIEEAHNLRLKIRDQTGLPPQITLPGHDMKLGRGGIREIEFYTQTRQLIAGGRDRTLRTRATLPALAALATAGWVKSPVQQTLSEVYHRHRRIEHAVQMVRDAQTQALPHSDEGMDRIAALLGMDLHRFKTQTLQDLEQTHSITDAFFDPPRPQIPDVVPFDTHLSDAWPQYPALRSTRASDLFARIRPQIMAGLAQAADPDDALRQFDAFLRGLPAGVQVFSLFAANPKLVGLLTNIIARSPALARYIGRNARVLDSLLNGDFFGDWPGAQGLCTDLTQHLAGRDYETQLSQARAWRNDWHFRIGVHLIQGLIPAPMAAQYYT
ncbi:MAG: glutamine-synthetase adenylyltransferase, partial [Pseudomonadota bacterium]